MSDNETAGSSAAASGPTGTRRWRPAVVVAMGVAAALTVASKGTGLYLAFQSGSASVAAVADTSAGTYSARGGDELGRTDTVPPERSGGFGAEPGSSAAASTALATTGATALQSVGVVVIDTVLKYESSAAAGTGIILTAGGEILTNNHVIDGATAISVTVVSTGASYRAVAVGTDASSDVAVLQLENASGLRTATLDTTSTVAMGDAVTGVGNAGGTSTLTAAAGRVTGLKQTITAQGEDGSDAQTLSGLIEVGADIQSGDSGGPLYDAEGEVIGINTAASSGSSNITGYAITIEDALGVVSAIESGAETSTITIGYPAFLGVALDSTRVIGVAAGSPANTAGLVAGDTITAIDGTPVASAETLAAVIDGRDPGERVTVAWLDAAGASRSATLILSAGPAD